MSPPLVLALLWMVAANLLALLPSRDGHWTQAAWLTVLGVPLLGWLTWEEGPVAGGLALLAGASLLRWPLILLWRRVTQ